MDHLKEPSYASLIFKNQSVERICVEESKLNIALSSFRWRGHRQHSSLPNNMGDETDLSVFKGRLKTWVRENVSI